MQINKDKVVERLNEKKATKPCHRCGHGSFVILDGFSNIQVQNDFSEGIVIGGPTLPVIQIVCNNCGAITLHALGALDMLPKEEGSDGKG